MERLNDHEKIIKYLKSCDLIHLFDDHIINQMVLKQFNRGELVFQEGQVLNELMVLVEGKLKVYVQHEDGKASLLRFIGPPSMYGDVELFTDFSVLCFVEAVDKAIFISIDKELIKAYAEQHPEFMKYIIRHLSSKLYTLSSSTSINMMFSVKSRLASYLLSMNREGQVDIPKLTILAPFLGTSYRHLTRTMKELVSEGIIRKKVTQITILKFEELRKLSQGNIYEVKN